MGVFLARGRWRWDWLKEETYPSHWMKMSAAAPWLTDGIISCSTTMELMTQTQSYRAPTINKTVGRVNCHFFVFVCVSSSRRHFLHQPDEFPVPSVKSTGSILSSDLIIGRLQRDTGKSWDLKRMLSETKGCHFSLSASVCLIISKLFSPHQGDGVV